MKFIYLADNILSQNYFNFKGKSYILQKRQVLGFNFTSLEAEIFMALFEGINIINRVNINNIAKVQKYSLIRELYFSIFFSL